MREKIETIVRGTLGKHSKNSIDLSGLYAVPNIKEKYLIRAANTFGAGVSPDEIILLVDSQSLIKKGSQGIFLTERHVYRSGDSNGAPAHIEINDIVSADFKANGENSTLFINGKPFYPGLNALAAKCLADILCEVRDAVNQINSEKEDIPEKLRQLEKLRSEQLISENEYNEIRARKIAKI